MALDAVDRKLYYLDNGPEGAVISFIMRSDLDGQNDKGTRVPTGIYFNRLQTKNFAATGRVVFIK